MEVDHVLAHNDVRNPVTIVGNLSRPQRASVVNQPWVYVWPVKVKALMQVLMQIKIIVIVILYQLKIKLKIRLKPPPPHKKNFTGYGYRATSRHFATICFSFCCR